MIQEFRVTNFLSFRDETVISFEPVGSGRKGKEHSNEKDPLLYSVNDKTKLLRLAIFYGANASGKSNILKAINFLFSFCKKKVAFPDAPTGVTPFLLNNVSKNFPTIFSIKFFVDNIRFLYTLELDSKRVHTESLYYYKTTQPVYLFKRTNNKLEFNTLENNISATAKELLELNCLPNLSFFASKAKVNLKLNIIDKVSRFFDEFYMDGDIGEERLFKAAEQYISESPDAKKHLIRFLQEADFNISTISSKKEEIPVPEDIRNSLLADPSTPEGLKEQLRQKSTYNRVKTIFTHTVDVNGKSEEYQLATQEQSVGTRRVFALESFLYVLEQTDCISHIDEIESSLHPNLVNLIISKYAKSRGSSSQLFISTHYTGLLDHQDLRDDCFWIVNKDHSGASTVQSVGKTKDMRLTSKEKGYRLGKLGGVPNIVPEPEPAEFNYDIEPSLF